MIPSRWIERRHRRLSTFVHAWLRPLPAPAQPTLCLFCDFEGRHAGEIAAAHASEGADRLLGLLDRVGTKITFNVVAELCGTHGTLVSRIRDAGHEVACHGWRHERPRGLTLRALQEMLDAARAEFARLSIVPTGFRSPESAWSIPLINELGRRGFRWNAERDPARRGYLIRRNLVRLPIRTDDWDLTQSGSSAAALFDKWDLALHRSGGLVAIGIHEWVVGMRPEFAERLPEWLKRCTCAGWHISTIGHCVSRLHAKQAEPMKEC